MEHSEPQYYRILHDPTAADRWFLDEPHSEAGEVIDARDFTQGKCYQGPPPKTLAVDRGGREVEFNLGPFDMPVVSSRVATAIQSVAPGDVECFPILITGAKLDYTVLNVVHRLDCVDERRSVVMKWRPEDGRPDKTGAYRMIGELTIVPTRVHGHKIFRIKGWEIALLISDDIRGALEPFENLGIAFQSVSPK